MSLFSSNDEHFCTPFALQNQTNTRRGQIEISRLEPENEYGNVEYKLRLTDPTPDRIEHLVTQLKWRIREGHGEAILFLGVKDDGQFVGLTQEETRLSLVTLERMSSKIGASMTVVKERIVDTEGRDESDLENIMKTKSAKTNRSRLAYEKHCKENLTNRASSSEMNTGSISDIAKMKKGAKSQRKAPIRKVIQVLVKRKTHDISEELRIAVLGPTESGKSSLLGVLSHGECDNGRGSARLNLFRHRHEVRSGHTSSISQEIFGFTSQGQPLTYNNCLTTEEIIESSSRIVTLIDLAGHQRYLSTTLFGLGSHSPDLVLIVVSGISTITNVIVDHISLALGMEKSVAIVINKVDLTSTEDQDICHDEIVRVFQSIDPLIMPCKITTLNDAMVAGSRLEEPKFLPIFFTSCVTGSGMDALYAFFNEISPKLKPGELDRAVSQSSELQVDETFEVPGIGTVVSGLIIEGTVREGDEMLLGPNDLGEFSNVAIVSLQRHKIPCNFARAGQKCTMAIRTHTNTKVRKGMVMKEVDPEWRRNFSVCIQFEANIKLINNKQHKLSGGQVSVYVGNVKQTCVVISIDSSAHDSLSIKLKLTKRPEYIREGSRIIIRHALMKAIGVVCRVEPLFGPGNQTNSP